MRSGTLRADKDKKKHEEEVSPCRCDSGGNGFGVRICNCGEAARGECGAYCGWNGGSNGEEYGQRCGREIKQRRSGVHGAAAICGCAKTIRCGTGRGSELRARKIEFRSGAACAAKIGSIARGLDGSDGEAP